MNYTTSHFSLIVLGYLRIPTDQVYPSQTLRCPGACDFPPQGHMVIFGPTGLHGLCFGFCFAGPLPLLSLTHGPLLRVHFGESLVYRLYSEIDHIHLSSEAQCVSHHLPLVDCHTNENTFCFSPMTVINKTVEEHNVMVYVALLQRKVTFISVMCCMLLLHYM